MKRWIYFLLLVVLLSLVGGCTTGRMMMTPAPQENYQRLGPVSGYACGSLGVIFEDLYFIPMGLNSRYELAYSDALAKAPGATALIDVTIREDWHWWFIGTARCVTLTGEAIK